MSLATCRECEAFIDTDEEEFAVVDDDFVCEMCVEEGKITLKEALNQLKALQDKLEKRRLQTREADKRFKIKHKEKIAKYGKEYKAKNKEKLAALHVKWRGENKEKLKIYNKEYAQANKERLALYRRERAKKKNKENM